MDVSKIKSSDAFAHRGDGSRRVLQYLVTAFSHTSALGFAICDDRLRFCAVNDALAAMNGLAVESHLGLAIRDVLGTAAEKLEPAFRRVLQTGQAIFPFELSVKLPTRRECGYWIETFFPIRGKSGKVNQVGATIVEVTRQRELEAFLIRFKSGIYRSRAREAQLLAKELRSSVEGYHSALAMSLTQLSQGLEESSVALPKLAASLDARLMRTQTLIAEVASAVLSGPPQA